MSNDATSQGQAPQPTEGQAAREVAAFFASESVRGFQPRLASVTGLCRFDITGAGSWLVHINKGMPTVTHDASDQSPADCVVACTAEDFVRVIRRESYLNFFAAMLQGLITVTGDLGFATALIGGVTLDTVELAPQSLPRASV